MSYIIGPDDITQHELMGGIQKTMLESDPFLEKGCSRKSDLLGEDKPIGNEDVDVTEQTDDSEQETQDQDMDSYYISGGHSKSSLS